MQYICCFPGPEISNATCRSNAQAVEQSVCLALKYFASGHFMYSIGDAEHLSKKTTVYAMQFARCYLLLLLDAFAVFPGHFSAPKIKKAFYRITGHLQYKLFGLFLMFIG